MSLSVYLTLRSTPLSAASVRAYGVESTWPPGLAATGAGAGVGAAWATGAAGFGGAATAGAEVTQRRVRLWWNLQSLKKHSFNGFCLLKTM